MLAIGIPVGDSAVSEKTPESRKGSEKRELTPILQAFLS